MARDKSEFAVTLDKALIYEYETNEQILICYVSRGETIPDDWVFEEGESSIKILMVVGIISGRGRVPLLRITVRVKINTDYYVNYVLKPLFSVHPPRFYPNEMDNFFLHHDKASSHTANLAISYLAKMKEELVVSYMSKEDTPIKTPDGSSLDFLGFGYLSRDF